MDVLFLCVRVERDYLWSRINKWHLFYCRYLMVLCLFCVVYQ